MPHEDTATLAPAAVTILDGGTGRELLRAGAPFRQPEWSALARGRRRRAGAGAGGRLAAADLRLVPRRLVRRRVRTPDPRGARHGPAALDRSLAGGNAEHDRRGRARAHRARRGS